MTRSRERGAPGDLQAMTTAPCGKPRASPGPDPVPRWLEVLARCLQRYVEQHPERYAIIEDIRGPVRVRRIVLRGTGESP